MARVQLAARLGYMQGARRRRGACASARGAGFGRLTPQMPQYRRKMSAMHLIRPALSLSHRRRPGANLVSGDERPKLDPGLRRRDKLKIATLLGVRPRGTGATWLKLARHIRSTRPIHIAGKTFKPSHPRASPAIRPTSRFRRHRVLR